MSSYIGMNGTVTYRGKFLRMTREAAKVSPTGFNWGYGGSGPYALAHSVLAHAYSVPVADEYAMDFKWEVIAALPNGEPFELTREYVRQWVGARLREANDGE